jgi:hypothetical protein
VHYGTTWDDSTLLEEIKQTNLELERKDGIRRHFRYDWQHVARYNPSYLQFVESERSRLGEDHPLFKTQYALVPVHGGGGFLSVQQRAQLEGTHSRLRGRQQRHAIYVAGIDLAGESEVVEDQILTRPGRDSTVITIAEVQPPEYGDRETALPVIKVVEHYCWTGENHSLVQQKMVDILKNIWGCSRIVIDATGIGEPVASFLKQAIGSRLIPFKFTQKSKSEAGFDLLAAVNSGRLKLYAADGSDEYRELQFELERAKSIYRPNQTLNFFVLPDEGHDDYLMSLALVVQAARRYISRKAKGDLSR